MSGQTQARARHSKPQMTRAYNETAAIMKATVAPLAGLTEAMLQSIARTHCGKREGDYDRLLAELQARVAERRGREG